MKKFLTRLWTFKQQKQKENDIPETKQIWKKNQQCLLDIFAKANLCIENSFFPSDLKLDNVTPTSKKKSKTLKTAMQAH